VSKRDIKVNISGSTLGGQIAIGDGNRQEMHAQEKQEKAGAPLSAELSALGKKLAALYPRELDQRRVARDAGLDEGAIAFDAVAYTSWSNIVGEAERAGAVEKLIAVAREEFPEALA
jgi:hypothetical protein